MDDAVDRLVDDLATSEPDLDLGPVSVVNRIMRLAPRFERVLADSVARHGLSLAEFSLLSILRRQGPPFRVAQRELSRRLLLTQATVSVRLDRLERAGLLRREPGVSGRRQDVVLTAEGRARMDAAVADHLDAEAGLVQALEPSDRTTLAALLRRLTIEHEGPEERRLPPGCTVAGARATQASYARLGQQAPATGLLVVDVEVGGAAQSAGMRVGDLIALVDDHPVLGLADLTPLDAQHGRAACSLRQDGHLCTIHVDW